MAEVTYTEVIIKNSNTLTATVATKPASLLYGELAINYKTGYEALFIKNDAGVIVSINDWAQLRNKPTTLVGYGITDAASSTHAHTFASLTSKPTTLLGYGITDAATSGHTHTFASLTSKPTTLGGYGITDAATSGHTHSYLPLAGGTVTGGTTFNGLINPVGGISNVLSPINAVTNNLGEPSVLEAALFHGQFTNKIRFIPPTIQEETIDNITWTTSTRASASQLRNMVRGEGDGSDFTLIPAAGVANSGYRLTWEYPSFNAYFWLNYLYCYCSTNGNAVTFIVEQYHNTSGWSTVASGSANNWPGHVAIRHTSIPFSNSASHYGKVRVSFIKTSAAVTNPVTMYALEWFGGYPAGRRNAESYDEYKNVTFPNGITAAGNSTLGGGVKLRYNCIEEPIVNGTSELAINYYGYGGGTSQYRNFGVYNGKNGVVGFFDGVNGRFGIGTNTPGYTCHVNGSIGIVGDSTFGGEIATQKNIHLMNTAENAIYTEGTAINIQKYDASWNLKTTIKLSDTELLLSSVKHNINVSATDSVSFLGINVNTANTINSSGASFFKLTNNGTNILNYTRKYNGWDTYDLILGSWSSIQASNRLDFWASQVFFNAGSINYQGVLTNSRTGDATSFATQKSSYPLVFQTSLWGGTSAVHYHTSIRNVASTYNKTARLGFFTGVGYDGLGGKEMMCIDANCVQIPISLVVAGAGVFSANEYGLFSIYGSSGVAFGDGNGTELLIDDAYCMSITSLGELNITGGSGVNVNCNLLVTGEITSTSASDVRLKSHIHSIRNSLQIIEKLNPVSYKWNDKAKELNKNKTDDTDVGLIAQELEEILPDIVHTMGNGYKSIDYIKLIPYLIDSIKELKHEINELKLNN